MFYPARPPVCPASTALASAAPSTRDIDLLELARAVAVLTHSASFPAPAPVPPSCSSSRQHRPHRSTPGGVVHNTPRRSPATFAQHSRTRPLSSSFNFYKSNEPNLAFERWKAQVAYPRKQPPTTSPVPQSPTIISTTHSPPHPSTISMIPSFSSERPHKSKSTKRRPVLQPSPKSSDNSNDLSWTSATH